LNATDVIGRDCDILCHCLLNAWRSIEQRVIDAIH